MLASLTSSTADGERQNVSGSMSAKTGMQPNRVIGKTAARQQNEGTITSSPGFAARSDTAMISPPTPLRTAVRLFAVAMLCLPAAWNRFPIVYDDVGGYLERWPTHSLGIGRSAAYGAMLWAAKDSWWVPIVAVQAAVTVWTIERTLAGWVSDGSWLKW